MKCQGFTRRAGPVRHPHSIHSAGVASRVIVCDPMDGAGHIGMAHQKPEAFHTAGDNCALNATNSAIAIRKNNAPHPLVKHLDETLEKAQDRELTVRRVGLASVALRTRLGARFELKPVGG